MVGQRCVKSKHWLQRLVYVAGSSTGVGTDGAEQVLHFDLSQGPS